MDLTQQIKKKDEKLEKRVKSSQVKSFQKEVYDTYEILENCSVLKPENQKAEISKYQLGIYQIVFEDNNILKKDSRIKIIEEGLFVVGKEEFFYKSELIPYNNNEVMVTRIKKIIQKLPLEQYKGKKKNLFKETSDGNGYSRIKLFPIDNLSYKSMSERIEKFVPLQKSGKKNPSAHKDIKFYTEKINQQYSHN